MSLCGVKDSACTQKSVRLYCGVGENARWRWQDILAAAVTVVEKGNSSGQEANAHLKTCTCRVGAGWPTPPRHHRPGRRLTRTASRTALWTALRPAGRARCLACRFSARSSHTLSRLERSPNTAAATRHGPLPFVYARDRLLGWLWRCSRRARSHVLPV
jgi:hypothetical protein